MKKNNLNIIIGVIFIVLITIGVIYYLFILQPELAKKTEEKKKQIEQEKIQVLVHAYKKEFYTGMVCEYQCPLTPQNDSKNKTLMLPEVDCLKNCTSQFKTKYQNNSFTKVQLTSDKFLTDIKNLIDNCKKESANQTTMVFNNSLYMDCNVRELENLKTKYPYLA